MTIFEYSAILEAFPEVTSGLRHYGPSEVALTRGCLRASNSEVHQNPRKKKKSVCNEPASLRSERGTLACNLIRRLLSIIMYKLPFRSLLNAYDAQNRLQLVGMASFLTNFYSCPLPKFVAAACAMPVERRLCQCSSMIVSPGNDGRMGRL